VFYYSFNSLLQILHPHFYDTPSHRQWRQSLYSRLSWFGEENPLLDKASSGVLADMCCVAKTYVPLMATIVAAIRTIAVHTAPPASLPIVAPTPRKRVMGQLVVTLLAHAATTTPVAISALSAVMTLKGDAVLPDLRA
jgi:hypothetical protein